MLLASGSQSNENCMHDCMGPGGYIAAYCDISCRGYRKSNENFLFQCNNMSLYYHCLPLQPSIAGISIITIIIIAVQQAKHAILFNQ